MEKQDDPMMQMPLCGPGDPVERFLYEEILKRSGIPFTRGAGPSGQNCLLVPRKHMADALEATEVIRREQKDRAGKHEGERKRRSVFAWLAAALFIGIPLVYLLVELLRQ